MLLGQHGEKRKIAIKVGNKPLASSDLLARMKNRNKIVSSVERPSNSSNGENIFFQVNILCTCVMLQLNMSKML